ncbi:TadE/TadG family type IV pilus assembly protein [Gellertiella hungarica]|nr:TadE/TadG family type IV pilus assembly protein [Gellertiella hungarica]
MAVAEPLRQVGARVGRLRRDRSGAGAVEFAILAPILLMLYISAFEITVGMSVAKRASRAAGTIADLVTQQSNPWTKATLSTMVGVAQSVFAPYNPANLKLKISGINIDSTGVARITWSWQQDNTRPYTLNAVVTIPTDLRNPNSFLVHAELQLDHQLGMFLANTMSYSTRTVTIKRDFYFRQRVGDAVTCGDC